jgi:hypothetical protein
MFTAIKQFFRAITVLFMALEKNANAINHLSTWCEESAGGFADKSRAERQKDMDAFNLKHGTNLKLTISGSDQIAKDASKA